MELTINDINSALQIIDVVTSRGAFRGEELTQVGALRDKFAACIKAAQDVQNAQGEVVEDTPKEEPAEY